MNGLRHQKDERVRGKTMPDISLDGRRVTFVSPPFQLPHNFIDYPMFMNLGLLHNAAVLERLGACVSVVDAIYSADELPLERGETWDRLGLAPAALIETIIASQPEIIVIHSSFFANPRYLDTTYLPELCRAIKERLSECPVILADMFLGGLNYFDYDPVPVAEALGVHAVLQGETEVLLPKTVFDLLCAHRPSALISGRGDRAGDFYPSDPDTFPDPAFHLLNMERYFKIQAQAQGENLIPEYHGEDRILPYMSSRGCPYACVFCTQQVLDLNWRGYSSSRLIESIEGFRDQYSIDRVLFLDDLMNLDGERFRTFAEHMERTQLPWDTVNGFRADRLNEGVLTSMKNAGNRKVTVSAESADQRVLDRIVRKGLKIEDIERVARTASKINYTCQIHYVIGFPGESLSEVNTTLLHADRMRRDFGAIALVQYATPVEGTRLHRLLDEGGLWASEEDRGRNVSSLFYSDSVIRTEHFSPEQLRAMRASSEQTMRDLDQTPRSLQLSTNDHVYRSADEIVREAREGSGSGRRVVLTGHDPILHPQLPTLLDRVKAEGVRVFGVQARPQLLFRSAVLELLSARNLEWLIVDMSAHSSKSEAPDFRNNLARIIQRLSRRGVRTSLQSTLDPNSESLVTQEDLQWWNSLDLWSVEVQAPCKDHEEALSPSLAQLDALANTLNPSLRVHGLAPCVVKKLSMSSTSASPYGSRRGGWRWLASPEPHGWIRGPRHRIGDCDSCVWRIGCSGLDER